jgi:hypothetical protein
MKLKSGRGFRQRFRARRDEDGGDASSLPRPGTLQPTTAPSAVASRRPAAARAVAERASPR